MVGRVRGHLAGWWRWFAKTAAGDLLGQREGWPLVVQFVTVLLLAVAVAEPFFGLTALAWERLWPLGGVGEDLEPSFRALALVVVATALLFVLARLIPSLGGKLDRELETGERPAAAPEQAALDRAIGLLIALLLVQSFAAEALIELARLSALAGGGLALALVLLLLLLLPALAVLAAATLASVRPFFAARFRNHIEEVSGRPAAWPARIVIAALSTPPERLIENDYAKLKRYERYNKASNVADRFLLFSDPCCLARRLGGDAKQAKNFVEGFNWRQIALAYAEQIPDDPPSAERLPRLILLVSEESAEHADAFKSFFSWLLKPFDDPGLADRLLEVHETEIDFEDLGHIEGKLKRVYDRACNQVGSARVVIDITGAQRPWALAAIGATLNTRDRIVSYVAQKPFVRGGAAAWVRYYDLDAERPEMKNPAKAQLGID